jgi:hypothetical protein
MLAVFVFEFDSAEAPRPSPPDSRNMTKQFSLHQEDWLMSMIDIA